MHFTYIDFTEKTKNETQGRKDAEENLNEV